MTAFEPKGGEGNEEPSAMPAELRELIALEKSALVDPGDARARLMTRLAVELGAAPLTTPKTASPNDARSTSVQPATAPSASAAPVLAPAAAAVIKGAPLVPVLAAFLAFGAGVGVGAVATKPTESARGAASVEIRYVDRVVTVERVVPAPPVSVPVQSASNTLPALPAAAASSTASSGAPKSAGSDTALAEERQLIDQARSALARGDTRAALAAIDSHASAYPAGQLREMREALAVQSLARAGRSSEAQARAGTFKRSFPGSVYSSVVDAAISAPPKIP